MSRAFEIRLFTFVPHADTGFDGCLASFKLVRALRAPKSYDAVTCVFTTIYPALVTLKEGERVKLSEDFLDAVCMHSGAGYLVRELSVHTRYEPLHLGCGNLARGTISRGTVHYLNDSIKASGRFIGTVENVWNVADRLGLE